MGFFGRWHAWRAMMVAGVLAWSGPAPDLLAGTFDSSRAPEVAGSSSEPFGLGVSRLFAGSLREKWRDVERKLDDERVQLALCEGDRERCAAPPPLLFLALGGNARAPEGRAPPRAVKRA